MRPPVLALALFMASPALAQEAARPPAPAAVVEAQSAQPLVGQWRVDLTSSPREGVTGRYYTDFVVTSVDDNRIEGTFYGSPIEQGRINRSWGGVRFAFVTHDGGGGTYNHSGELVDGRLIRGLSQALDRDFLSVWTAVPGTIDVTSW